MRKIENEEKFGMSPTGLSEIHQQGNLSGALQPLPETGCLTSERAPDDPAGAGLHPGQPPSVQGGARKGSFLTTEAATG